MPPYSGRSTDFKLGRCKSEKIAEIRVESERADQGSGFGLIPVRTPLTYVIS
jgi:hypothetical protein